MNDNRENNKDFMDNMDNNHVGNDRVDNDHVDMDNDHMGNDRMGNDQWFLNSITDNIKLIYSVQCVIIQ